VPVAGGGGASLVWFVFPPCCRKSVGRRRPALFPGRGARSVRCAGCCVLGMGAASKEYKLDGTLECKVHGTGLDQRLQSCSNAKAGMFFSGHAHMDRA